MKILEYKNLSENEKIQALKRPAIKAKDDIVKICKELIADVRQRGDKALIEQALNFDKVEISSIKVSKDEIQNASKRLSKDLKEAIKTAYNNIHSFHKAQEFKSITVNTMPGVKCELVSRPIDSVGLYIPGGLAPLLSTTLMLAIPAKIAKCKRIVLASPAKIDDAILYCAKLCGVDEVYQMGGAGAVAALAYGSESVKKVDKIFGPGNAFVTAAKSLVSADIDGCVIDMQAGPSEVLVIADDEANVSFVASDLLSQAEHGADSQVILLCLSMNFAKALIKELEKQLSILPRKEIASKAIENSRIIIVKDLNEALEVSNAYAPEHLILQCKEPRKLVPLVKHAGSVFLGEFAPESMGDYASGTNHVLPTYGLTRVNSSLSLSDFYKKMTVQELSKNGFKRLAKTVEILAQAEQLQAHKNAVSIRLKSLNA
ncbi:MAG TPA: histidinol dehydrogenase [Campylobacter avium]|uniref:histidinol dehydrogenase n=1 Tax=Campylobacter avium TaxID=522485 RepID=UPI001E084DC6|nr:histidinol dehydrogenase [Campylobacter avium]HJE65719.1 histidinol dehydrogenase [Campylobacter avium]